MMRYVAGAICLFLVGAMFVGSAEAAKKANPKKEKVEYLRAAGSEPPAKAKKK